MYRPMNLEIFQVDAFTEHLFSGSPAAICPLKSWLSDKLMQSIAAENNLAETAFFIKEEDAYHLRWFTPTVEVKLCGHATLACAFVLFNHMDVQDSPIHFRTLSGSLYVHNENEGSLTMDFPLLTMEPCATPQALWESLGAHPEECLKGEDYMAVFPDEETLLSLQPDFRQMATLPCRGIIATARGDHCDFVSRFFAPQSGIDEDPVTGSSHAALAPYWAKKLNKTTLKAIQRSQREGTVFCRVEGNRVHLTGKAQLYLKGCIEIPDTKFK